MDEVDRPPDSTGLAQWTRRHRALVDAGATLAVLILATPDAVLLSSQDRATAIVLTVALVAPVIARRRLPRVTFAVIAVVALVQCCIGTPLVADVALLVSFATVAANRPTRDTLVAGAVLETGVVVAVARWTPHGWPLSLVFLSGLCAAAGLMGVNIRTRRAYLAHLEDRARRLERERDQQILLAEAAERARIARELHDVVAHHLTVVITLADAASRLPDAAAGRGRELMATVSATGRTALTEMRRLLGVLREDRPDRPDPADDPAEMAVVAPDRPDRTVRPDRTDRTVQPVQPDRARTAAPPVDPAADPFAGRSPQPDLDRLDELIARFRAAGLAVALTVSGERPPLEPGVELTLYRAVQEALTNTLRHAGSTSRAAVQLTFAGPRVRASVSDGGPDRLPVAGLAGGGVRPVALRGHGLIGMRERVLACGGAMTAGPRADGGWEVRVEVPVVHTAALIP